MSRPDAETAEAKNSEQAAESIDEEGYRTPTTEDHRIPEVSWSCPPPAPRKRKRLFLQRRSNIKKLQTETERERGAALSDEALELFFQSFAVESSVPPPPESQPPRRTVAKKRRVH